MINFDRYAYFRSLSDELRSQSKRVRNLIADRHWLSDGHQKEYLLTSLIARHIPSTMLVTRGFVADLTTGSCSDEQDILIIDTLNQGPLFSQGGLTVSFPNSVVATISVKSQMTTSSVKQAIENQNSVRDVLAQSGQMHGPYWSGGYFFQVGTSIKRNPVCVYDTYQAAAENFRTHDPSVGMDALKYPGPNLLCDSESLVYRLVSRRKDDNTRECIATVFGYECAGLATAIFLATLLDHIAAYRNSSRASALDLVDHEEIVPLKKGSISFDVRTK